MRRSLTIYGFIRRIKQIDSIQIERYKGFKNLSPENKMKILQFKNDLTAIMLPLHELDGYRFKDNSKE